MTSEACIPWENEAEIFIKAILGGKKKFLLQDTQFLSLPKEIRKCLIDESSMYVKCLLSLGNAKFYVKNYFFPPVKLKFLSK